MRNTVRPACYVLPILAGVSLVACVRIPTGPNVMALPGTGKSFEQFIADDALCREWAARRIGVAAEQAPAEAAAKTAALGTAVGAASGAAIGAATGSAGTGAAVGAGAGLLGGTVVGADYAESVRWSLQRRYDAAYMQCMYANGNQIPISRGALPSSLQYTAPRPRRPADVPPPPPGPPPPPPPDAPR